MSYAMASGNSGSFGAPQSQKKFYYGMLDAVDPTGNLGEGQRAFDNKVNNTRSNVGVRPVVGTNPVDPYPYKSQDDEQQRQWDSDFAARKSVSAATFDQREADRKVQNQKDMEDPSGVMGFADQLVGMSNYFKPAAKAAPAGQPGRGPYDQSVIVQEPELPFPATRSLNPRKEDHFVKLFVQEGWVRPRQLADEGVFSRTRQRTRLVSSPSPPPPPPSYPGSSSSSRMSSASTRRSSYGGDTTMEVDNGDRYPFDPKRSFRHNFVGPLLPGQYRRKPPVKKKAVAKKKTTYKRSYGSYGRSTGLKVYRPLNLVAGRIHGRGDYSMASNAAAIRKNSVINMGVQIPSFGDMSLATIVRHREFIQDITAGGSTAFTVLPFALNPAQAGTFPWLSQLAVNYDQYQLIGCVFEYITTSSESATSLPMGSVIMGTDYDSVDSNFGTKQIMENSQYCTSGKPSCSLMHAIECDPRATSTPIKYVRQGVVPGGSDIRLYDHGIFQLATVGLPVSSGNIGELWVTYEIALYKPQLRSTASGGLIIGSADHFRLGSTWASPMQSTGFGTSLAVAAAKTAQPGSALGFKITDVNVITAPVGLPAGAYKLTVTWVGASTTLTNALAVTFGTGLVAAADLYGGTTTLSNVTAGAVAVQQLGVFFFNCLVALTATTTITFTAGTLPGTPTQGDIFIERLPDALT